MKNLENKVVWITGASSGIGEALAHAFAAQGARLVLSARRLEELKRVQNDLKITANRVMILPVDVLKMEEFDALTQIVVGQFGQIDVLVLNAGVSQRTLFVEMAANDAKRLMDTNFTSIIALTKAVLPQMLKQQSGAFLVTSSVSGKVGTPYRTMYCASKHALQGFFDGLRGELWQSGIGVTVACPGYIKTNISYNAIGKDGQPFGQMDVNQQKGISADVCARKMVAALQAGKHEVVIAGFMETIGTYLKRFAPAILWQFVKKYNIKAVDS
jgi:dehydrogenase/reductase SDR family member 7